jgi:hypothetical protein
LRKRGKSSVLRLTFVSVPPRSDRPCAAQAAAGRCPKKKNPRTGQPIRGQNPLSSLVTVRSLATLPHRPGAPSPAGTGATVTRGRGAEHLKDHVSTRPRGRQTQAGRRGEVDSPPGGRVQMSSMMSMPGVAAACACCRPFQGLLQRRTRL